MYIIRPIESKDEKLFLQLALSSPPGILTLPRNPLRVKQKLIDSLKAFASEASENGCYLFVLENLETHQLEGCSAILSSVNLDYHYKVEHHHRLDDTMEQIPKVQTLLYPQINHNNASEICTLFLTKSNRKRGLGRLLSLSRFLFVASHRERFESEFMAEMRGVIDSEGKCPFWDGLGRHFCNLDLNEILALYEANIEIAEKILPDHPIYCSLLPQEVQDVIGKVHPSTVPALKMLENQGFTLRNWIDILDGGPRIYAETSEIQIIKTTIHAPVTKISSNALTENEDNIKLISNRKLNFRACYGVVIVEEQGVTIDASTARNLEVETGELICFANIIHSEKEKTDG